LSGSFKSPHYAYHSRTATLPILGAFPSGYASAPAGTKRPATLG
jgi:hypothetical protein